MSTHNRLNNGYKVVGMRYGPGIKATNWNILNAGRMFVAITKDKPIKMASKQMLKTAKSIENLRNMSFVFYEAPRKRSRIIFVIKRGLPIR